MKNVDRFQVMLRDWLARNELDDELNFYSGECWRARKEDFLNDAEFVIATEGGLCFLLNYNYAHPMVDELQDLCASFGYWFELGHVWSVGFYRDEEEPTAATPIVYREKLKDSRWRNKAAKVKARASFQCQDCGVAGTNLEAHHCWYRYGFEPWQYPLDALRALCRDCHVRRAPVEHAARTLMARFSTNEVDRIRGAVERLFHWYDRQAVLRLLESLGPDEREMEIAIAELRNHKSEPGAV